jgi:PAS domain S-box-containing protein
MPLDQIAPDGIPGKNGDSCLFSLIQSIPDAIFVISPQGIILDVNAAFAAQFNKTPEEFFGLSVFNLMPPEVGAVRMKMLQEAFLSSKPLTFDDEDNGQLVRSTIYPFKSLEGNVDRLLIIAQDITDIGKLLKKEQLFNKQIIESIPGTFFLLDPNGRFVSWNDRVREMCFGVSENGITDTFGIDILHPENRSRAVEVMADIINNNADVTEEFRFVLGGGTDIRWHLLTAKRIIIDASPFIIGVGIDITEQKIAEDALQKGEERFRNLFECNAAIMILLDPDTGNIVDANKAAADFYGWSIDELRQMKIARINPLSTDDIKGNLEKVRSTGSFTFTFRHLRKDGSLRDVEVLSTKINDGRKDLLYEIIHDVTDKKRYEQVNTFRLRILQMADTYSTGELLVVTIDEAEKISGSSIGFFHLIANDQKALSLQAWSTNTTMNMCKAEGKGQHYPMNLAGVWADASRFKKPIIHNDYPSLEHRIGMPEGHAEIKRELIVPVIRDGKTVAIMGVGNKQTDYGDKDIEWLETIANHVWDIIAKKIAEEENKKLTIQLQHAAKMNMIGQLAAGIAHEINNPLNFITITGHNQLNDFNDLQELVDDYRKIIEKVDTIPSISEEVMRLRQKEKEIDIDDLLENIPRTFEMTQSGVERISVITKSMRNYSFKNETGSLSLSDINKAVDESLLLAKSEYRDAAIVDLRLEDLPLVMCDLPMISQVLLNLIVNSAHAIKSQNRKSQGSITIKTWATGEHVFCSVSDDGPGIPEEMRMRIFEPFFTTKDIGKGTGLGLSISYDIIVNKHKGSISAEGLAEGGTVFTITLPLKH